MSAASRTRPSATPNEVDEAMSAFSSIADNLRQGYAALAARAEVVEEELRVANAQLESKVFELERVRRHLEAVLDSLPTGVVVRDEQGRVERVNEPALEILDAERADLMGALEPAALVTEPAGSAMICRGGVRRIVAARYSGVRTRDGESLGSVEVLDDRTEFQELAERVHRLDKMAALGTMAGGIAHEIRNPMNAIKGFAALLLRGMQQESREGRWASLICEGVDEVNAIVSGLLNFASPERLQPEALDLAALVEESLELVRRDLSGAGDGSNLLHSLESEVCDGELTGDRIMLRQSLRNLVANAIDAQPEGGPVLVRVSCDAQQCCFSVEDAGSGIPEELAGRVADPFFTTRSEGTGLGLALVHTVAGLHGGRLEISPEASALGGARVLLKIPRLPYSDKQ